MSVIIIEDLCEGCGECAYLCPMGAISIRQKKALVDLDKCVECNTCVRSGICKNAALREDAELRWPRLIRKLYSDVLAEFEATGVTGRGTEEMKSNDVTGRYGCGEVGLAVDVGRPGRGAFVKDIQKVITALLRVGCELGADNPLAGLFDVSTGECLRPETLDERVLSAVVEAKCPISKCASALNALKTLAETLDTCFSVGVITRIIDGEKIEALEVIRSAGFEPLPSAKINVGLGRPGEE